MDLLADRKGLTKSAYFVGADALNVKRWKRDRKQDRATALASRPNHGRPSKLAAIEKCRLAKIVRAGPLQAGYTSDWYICRRVAELIRRQFDVTYLQDLDRLNDLRSVVRRLQERNTQWLNVEWLPAYAPT